MKKCLNAFSNEKNKILLDTFIMRLKVLDL